MTAKFPRATEKYHMDIDMVFIDSGAWKKCPINIIGKTITFTLKPPKDPSVNYVCSQRRPEEWG